MPEARTVPGQVHSVTALQQAAVAINAYGIIIVQWVADLGLGPELG